MAGQPSPRPKYTVMTRHSRDRQIASCLALCVVLLAPACGSAVPPFAHVVWMRGGVEEPSSMDPDDVDAFINQLVSSVNDETDQEQLHVSKEDDETNNEDVDHQAKEAADSVDTPEDSSIDTEDDTEAEEGGEAEEIEEVELKDDDEEVVMQQSRQAKDDEFDVNDEGETDDEKAAEGESESVEASEHGEVVDNSEALEKESKGKDGNGTVSTKRRRKREKTTSSDQSTSGIDEALPPDDAIDESSGKAKNLAPSEEEGSSSKRIVRRGPPPSPLYRFLLQQGGIGRWTVMGMVLWEEWIEAYLPPLFRLFVWLGSRLGPKPRGRNGGNRKTRPTTAAAPSLKTGQSRKVRKQLTKQADMTALEQLSRLDSVDEAKYTHVSDDFLRRHRLGPYADGWTGEDEHDEKASSTALIVPFLGSDDDDEAVVETQQEDDWVVQALAAEKPIQPIVDVSMGSDGGAVSVGLEFSLGGKKRRQSVIEAVTTTKRKKKRASPGPRSSDRDSGLMGRIRAASANSLVSRSLLGAYPGDAAPPSEAGSALGVEDLARRYGWGDWSDEDENSTDDDGNDRPTRRKRRRKRQRKPQSGFSVGFEFGGGASTSISSAHQPRSSSRNTDLPISTRGAAGRKTSTNVSTRDSTIASVSTRRSTTTVRQKVTPIRPAMAVLREAQSRHRRKPKDE